MNSKGITAMTKGALSGITVLDLSRLLPGPYCSMILADHGARVITIENPVYKAEDTFPHIVNRNKEHISLNLKHNNDYQFFLKLAKSADIIIEGFRPGVVKKLNVDYESIYAINPSIIYCAITGYGQTGSRANNPGHDVNYLAIAGVLDLIGQKDLPPSIPGVQIADISGGSMQAVTGILLALFERTRSGTGQYIDISMTDGSVALMHLALNFQQLTGSAAIRSDSILSHRYAFYNTYETRDHRYLTVGALEFKFWKNLCQFLNVPEYIPLQYDEARRMDIITHLKRIFKTKSLHEWTRAFADIDVCCAPVKTLPEVLEDPLFIDRDLIVDTTDKYGNPAKTIGVPIRLSRTPGSVRTPPVKFGESNTSVFKEFGYGE